MAEGRTFGQRWSDYRASKATLFWSCMAFVVLTMVVGFTWGGWVTGGTAQEMVEQARAELAATVCVERFLDAADVQAQYASFKETSTWQRDEFVREGGWAKVPGIEEPIANAAEICADRLEEVELPPSGAQATDDSAPTTTAVQ